MECYHIYSDNFKFLHNYTIFCTILKAEYLFVIFRQEHEVVLEYKYKVFLSCGLRIRFVSKKREHNLGRLYFIFDIYKLLCDFLRNYF